MQNYNAGEVNNNLSGAIFCQKSDYFFEFFAPAENYKKAVSTGFEQNLRIKLLFFEAAKTA